ncbi:hypothetical protein BDK51DRAFT_11918, partial [Blyttiomyces helicus]
TATAHAGTVNGLAFTSDGLHLVSTAHDNKMRLWDVFTGRNTLTNYGPTLHNTVSLNVTPAITPLSDCFPPLVFHPSNREVLVFDLWSGELVTRLKGHGRLVRCVALR